MAVEGRKRGGFEALKEAVRANSPKLPSRPGFLTPTQGRRVKFLSPNVPRRNTSSATSSSRTMGQVQWSEDDWENDVHADARRRQQWEEVKQRALAGRESSGIADARRGLMTEKNPPPHVKPIFQVSPAPNPFVDWQVDRAQRRAEKKAAVNKTAVKRDSIAESQASSAASPLPPPSTCGAGEQPAVLSSSNSPQPPPSEALLRSYSQPLSPHPPPTPHTNPPPPPSSHVGSPPPPAFSCVSSPPPPPLLPGGSPPPSPQGGGKMRRFSSVSVPSPRTMQRKASSAHELVDEEPKTKPRAESDQGAGAEHRRTSAAHSPLLKRVVGKRTQSQHNSSTPKSDRRAGSPARFRFRMMDGRFRSLEARRPVPMALFLPA